MRASALASLLIFLVAASPALAHHVSGTVYCDQNSNGSIDAGDTPIAGIKAVATSLDAVPGQQADTFTDANGAYYILLFARTDRYLVNLTDLPGGLTIVVPSGGSYTVQIITASANDHVDGLDFLVQGCAPPTTTTSTTTTSTTSTSAPTTSTSTTTSTTTTTSTLPVCQCAATPFLAARDLRLNNDGDIRGNVGVNDPGGRLRLGKAVTMPDGTSVTGDAVLLGNGTSVYQTFANTLLAGPGSVVRGGSAAATLPIVPSFCGLPAITCGTTDVLVGPGQRLGPLAPGVYGRLQVLNGGAVTLSAGTFTFCDVKTGRDAAILTLGPAQIDVERDVVIGTNSRIGPDSGSAPVLVNVAGKMVRVSQSGEANAAFVGPDARISFGRDAHLVGCFCTDRAKSDKHITLECPAF
jgi:hypothetical protein